MHITTNRVFRDSRKVPYCHDLLRLLGKSEPDDEPVEIGKILEIIPAPNLIFEKPLLTALYLTSFVEGHDKERILMGIDYARLVQDVPGDGLLKETLDLTEGFLSGGVSEEELASARNTLKEANNNFGGVYFTSTANEDAVQANFSAYIASGCIGPFSRFIPWQCCALAMYSQKAEEDPISGRRLTSPDWVKKYEAVLKKYL